MAGPYDFYLNGSFIRDYLPCAINMREDGMDLAIIDTHLHLIYRERLRYPWLADVAALDRDFPYERYQTEAGRCGVTDAIHMEVDVAAGDIEAETRNVDALATEPGTLLRGAISSCRPEDGVFQFLERQLANPFVKGSWPGSACRSGRGQRIGHIPEECAAPGRIGPSVLFPACPPRPDRQGDRAGRGPRAGRPPVLDHCGVPAIKERASIHGASASSRLRAGRTWPSRFPASSLTPTK